uniref:Zgc:113425 n=1 Tax=Oryzias latipes TaxID=8090 RepID=A0A3B3H5U6_ORYLA
MDRYRYFIFNQKGVLILGILQIACAGLCVVCGCMDAAFRKSTPLSRSRTPLWGGLIMASPGVLALFASQRKNSVLVSAMLVAAGLSCVASVVISGYCGLTLTYGEEDEDVFHHLNTAEAVNQPVCIVAALSEAKLHNLTYKTAARCGKNALISPQTVVLHRMVKGANSTIILTCVISLLLSSLIAFVGCRSLPFCGCYDNRTGLEATTGSSILQLSQFTETHRRRRRTPPPERRPTAGWPDASGLDALLPEAAKT